MRTCKQNNNSWHKSWIIGFVVSTSLASVNRNLGGQTVNNT